MKRMSGMENVEVDVTHGPIEEVEKAVKSMKLGKMTGVPGRCGGTQNSGWDDWD